MVKIAPDDKLKQYNWCGIYCTEDSYDAPSLGTGSRVVNYVGIKKSTDTYTRKTGTLTGLDAQYNWNGLQTTNPAVQGLISTILLRQLLMLLNTIC